MILLESNFFEKADKHVELSRVFLKEAWYDTLSLWADMVIFPLITIGTFLYNPESPSMFSMLTFYKAITLWLQWLEYSLLTTDIREWTNIVRSVDGPFISTNDPTYHVFVYADGIQRLHHSFFPKK
jgi:hypothetical protein